MKNIAVAVDFDEEANDVIEWAANLAERYQANLHLIHIHQQHPDLAPYVYPGSKDPLEAEAEREGQKVQEFVEQLSQRGIQASGYLKGGDAVESLLDFAKHRGADLLVVGSHRKNRLEEAVLGSVANGIVRKAEVPVLVVPRARS